MSANRAVPGLIPAVFEEEAADVTVEMDAYPDAIQSLLQGPSSPWPPLAEAPRPHDDRPVVATFEGGRYFRIRYPEAAEFVLDSSGTRIWCPWHADQSVDHTALYLTGPVLGFVLRLRGLTCLHASGVVFPQGAVGFVGASGVGKSTLALAFGARGRPVLADDILALRMTPSGVQATPAHGRLRLWPDALEHLEGADHRRPRLVSDWSKRYVDLQDGSVTAQDQPVPLRVLYVLEDGSAENGAGPNLQPLRPSEALARLAMHTYRADWLSPAMRAQEFDFLGSLVVRVPVRSLRCVRGLTELAARCDLIAGDVETLAPLPSGQGFEQDAGASRP
ncbi:MAG: hypothetical protein P1V36_12170 [Planctomycetota bacterium]|nr:hypothetical protein [Planctomycetota bacterium]